MLLATVSSTLILASTISAQADYKYDRYDVPRYEYYDDSYYNPSVNHPRYVDRHYRQYEPRYERRRWRRNREIEVYSPEFQFRFRIK